MVRKAVDIVLLPSEAMMDRAIEVNSELVERFGRKIVLNKENCLPHISLAMGCMDEEDIAAVKKVLETIGKESALGDLKVVGISGGGNSRGESVSVFEVENTKELQSLHERVMGELGPYLSYDVTEDMTAGAEVEELTLVWIKNYAEKSSFANFYPHITIGYGQISSQQLPIKFTVSKLALCHLGNHCTCRKILLSVELNL